MTFVLLINLKLLTIGNYLFLNIAEHDIFSPNRQENAKLAFSYLLGEKFHAQLRKFHAQRAEHENSFFITSAQETWNRDMQIYLLNS